jgi:hypothetical protein
VLCSLQFARPQSWHYPQVLLSHQILLLRPQQQILLLLLSHQILLLLSHQILLLLLSHQILLLWPQ